MIGEGFSHLICYAPPPSLHDVGLNSNIYFYDKKESSSAWFAFSLVFNSTVHRGTLNLMDTDPIAEKTA
jgi:hypothetical protein